jgi:TatD DNase family protein
MMARYINIHTHMACKDNDICIRNILVSDIPDEKSYRETPYSVGMHPWYLGNLASIQSGLEKMEIELANPQCIAIGECGLDMMTQTPMELQIKTFKDQIRLAERFNKPVIIHCVKAYNEILKLRKTMHAQTIWIFHGFNSSLQIAEQIIDAGCMLSFGHQLLQTRSKALEVLPMLDADDFFLETDDHPVTIKEVYTRAAEIRQIPVAELCLQQKQNYQSLVNF